MTQQISESCFIDNIKFMRQFPDNFFDFAPIDPSWGRKEDGRKKRGGMVTQKNGSKIMVKSPVHQKSEWDEKPASKMFFKELFRVSKHQVIWGENYYHKKFGPGRIIWDKCNEGSAQSDCEIAYNSLTDRVDIFRFMWRGMLQGKSITEGHIAQGNKSLNEVIIHPTQKPLPLHYWILKRYAKPGWKILDTGMGSQGSRIAAWDLGFDFWGCENNLKHFQDGEARFKNHISQFKLFDYSIEKSLQNWEIFLNI